MPQGSTATIKIEDGGSFPYQLHGIELGRVQNFLVDRLVHKIIKRRLKRFTLRHRSQLAPQHPSFYLQIPAHCTAKYCTFLGIFWPLTWKLQIILFLNATTGDLFPYYALLVVYWQQVSSDGRIIWIFRDNLIKIKSVLNFNLQEAQKNLFKTPRKPLFSLESKL